jgi:hypothetical protein
LVVVLTDCSGLDAAGYCCWLPLAALATWYGNWTSRFFVVHLQLICFATASSTGLVCYAFCGESASPVTPLLVRLVNMPCCAVLCAAAMEKESEGLLKSLDAQAEKISDQVLKRVLPEGVKV